MKKTFFVDVETTGKDCKVHGIVQIAYLIEIDGKVELERNFEVAPFKEDLIEDGALAVSGRTFEQVKEYPKPSVVYHDMLKDLGKFVNKYDKKDKFTVAGYNVRFDTGFVYEFFQNNGDKYYGSWFNWKLVDPLPLLHFWDYLGRISLPNYQLGTVCEHYGIPLNAHDALSDVKATRELIRKIGAVI